MANPVLRIGMSVQFCALDVNSPVGLIEIEVPDRGGLIRDRMGNADGFEERRDDKVHVLSGVREKAYHGEDGEGAHSTGIVVTGEPGVGSVEA